MYLIDSDILIYLIKQHSSVVNRFHENREDGIAISVITYGELYAGALKSQHVQLNLAKLRIAAEELPTIPITKEIMTVFATIKTDMQKQGTPLDDFDLLIAATARYLGFRLVTNNERHFSRIEGLVIENWTT